MLAHSITFRHRRIPDKFPLTLTKAVQSARIEEVLPKSGPVAQLGARFHGMEEVIGSIPIRSTKSFQAFSRSPPKPFARILPANGKIFARDGASTLLTTPSVVLFCCVCDEGGGDGPSVPVATSSS